MFTTQLGSFSTINTPKDFGLCSLLFAPKEWLTAVPDFESIMQQAEEDAVAITAFDFIAGKTWLTFDDMVADAAFSEEEKRDKRGPFSESETAFILNGDNYGDRGVRLRAMKGEFIVISRAANGTWRLQGNLQRGADFTYKYNSAKGVNECAFTWQSSDSCLYIDIEGIGALPDPGSVAIIDQDNNEIDSIAAPGEYHVIVFSGIRDTGPAYSNSIIDNG